MESAEAPAGSGSGRGTEWAVRAFGLIAVAYMTYYMAWRWTSTLNTSALWISVPLALAETYIVLRSYFMLFEAWKLAEPEWRPAPRDLKVDVFITTYNEPLEILRRTALAARDIAYPHQTFILDDGKRDEVRFLAQELGVRYMWRRGNAHAKAGNLNHALRRTRGEFILQLDADHVPLPNILDRLLGFFVSTNIAYVQSPQEFYNTDSFMHSVKRRARRIWDEQRFFFGVLQPGRARLNAAIFCGSCGVIRRAALRETGGFLGETITEDMETSLVLHSRGWKSVYTPEALAYGLAPDTFLQFQVQRLRWAQGTMQLFRKYNPLTYPGLTLAQRICYFDSFFYYFEGVASVFLFLAPAAYLVSGVLPIATTNAQFLKHFIPYLVLSIGSFELLARGTGYFWLLARYNVARFWIYIHALGGYFAKGRLKFEVTPKTAGHVPLRVYAPQLVLALVLSLSLLVGVLGRLSGRIPGPGLASLAFALSAVWVVWTLWLALGVVRAARAERAQRGEFRFRDVIPAEFAIVGPDVEAPIPGLALTEDLNRGGLALRTTQELAAGTQLRISLPLARTPVEVTGEVVHSRGTRAGREVVRVHGVRFLEVSPDVGDAIEMHCMQHAVPSLNLLFRHEHGLLSRIARWLYDTRKQRRQALEVAAEVRALTTEGDPQGRRLAVLDEMGNNGARLLLEEPLAPGTRVQVTAPGSGIAFAGRVVFARALPTGLSVRFVVGVVHEGTAAVSDAAFEVPKDPTGGFMGDRVSVGVWGHATATLRSMANRLRVASVLALALGGAVFSARPAAAQSPWGVTFYNADEWASDNVELGLLGASMSRRAQGVSPVFSVQGYGLHFPGTTQWAVTPSAGLKLGFQGGAVQGRVGYTWVNQTLTGPAAALAPGGGQNGVVTTVQADYWGVGRGSGQAIVNYNWGGETLWTRGRLGTRVAQMQNGSVSLGAEAAYLRANKNTTYDAWQFGPTLTFNTGHGFIATLSGGPKLQNPGKTAGYVHLDLVLTP